MHPRDFFVQRKGFTLIELLVVIAIIAILAVVVVLTLNPAQLLAQSRDANRVSDMATLNTAIGLYQTDMGGTGTMGTSTVVYVSLPDNASTTCGSLGLPALPTGNIYDCSPATSSRLTNNQGWIPIDFTKISSGAPFGSLPLDPVNSTSSGLSYDYVSSGTRYMVSANVESAKQKLALATNPLIPNFPDVIANGSSLTISPIFNPSGLVAYWMLDDGPLNTAKDISGNNNSGAWSGTPQGTNNTFFIPGKVGPWAGFFNASNDWIAVASPSAMPSGDMSVVAWVSRDNSPYYGTILASNQFRFTTQGGHALEFNWRTYSVAGGNVTAGVYHHVAGIKSGNTISIYIDGQFIASSAISITTNLTGISIGADSVSGIGSPDPIGGSLDDVRIYNRALSPAEIQALYNAEK